MEGAGAMIQVYTGDGKGKTTAALGLALRASGAGLKVYIGQFIKKGNYCEVKALHKIKNIKAEQFGRGCFIMKSPTKVDREMAQAGLARIKKAIEDKIYDVVVLDEVNVALKIGLLDLKQVLELIQKAPKKTELILTGRWAHPQVIKAADLVSEIKEIKHYYRQGLRSRLGIEC
jgi:cob(I)alamin adenosyltransferase